MKIAILGGRFDPPHFGHYWIARQVLDFCPDIKQVFLVPAAQHQWKPTEANEQDRLSMLRHYEEENIVVSDLEIKRGGISYSIDTIQALKAETGAEIFWIVGADIIPEFHRWGRAEELTQQATFLVFPRNPYELPPVLPKGFDLVSNNSLVTTNISSTLIRQRVKENKSIHNMVHEKVETYIKKRGLYK